MAFAVSPHDRYFPDKYVPLSRVLTDLAFGVKYLFVSAQCASKLRRSRAELKRLGIDY